jgi:hypothetical protein
MDSVNNEIRDARIFGTVVQAGSIDSLTVVSPGAASVPVEVAVRDPRSVFESALSHGFTGRTWLIDQIDGFLARHPCGYVWIEADAGMGKTALAAHLVRERGWISHFARYSNGGSVQAALQNLAGQLVTTRALGDLAPGRMLPEWSFTPEGFENLLARAAGGDPLVLVVDGADEAVTPPGGHPWGLPGLLPPGVFVVGTYRTGSPPPHCDAPRTVLRIAADALNRDDLVDHLHTLLASDAGLAGLDVARLADRCSGVWVYLRYVLDEIRLGLRTPTDLDDLPRDLRSFYLAQLNRWRDAQDVVVPLLATLAVAREALTLPELSILSEVDENRVRQWCDHRLRPFLTATPTTPRRFEIYHASLRELLTRAEPDEWSEVLHPATLSAHHRIADHGLRRLDSYARYHLASHLVSADRLDDLEALLRKEEDGRLLWFGVHAAADTLDRYLSDLSLAREHFAHLTDEALKSGRTAPSFARELHYLMMTASINSITENVTPQLLEAALDTGVWSPDQALAHVRRVKAPQDRVSLLAAALPHLPPQPHATALTDALADVELIEHSPPRLRALAGLAPNLNAERIALVLTEVIAERVTYGNPYLKREIYQAIASRLTAGQLDLALADVFAPDGELRAVDALEALAPHLSKSQLDRMMRLANSFADRSALKVVLEAFAPHLSAVQLNTALTMATANADAPNGAGALISLLPHLPERSRRTAVQTVIELADRHYGPDGTRLNLLTPLAPHLDAGQLHELYLQVNEIDDVPARLHKLHQVVPHLPSGLRSAAASEIHRIAMTFWNEDVTGDRHREQADALIPVAAHLSRAARADALHASATTVNTICSGDFIGPTLNRYFANLVPHFDPAEIEDALRITASFRLGSARVEALTALAPRLTPDQHSIAADIAQNAKSHTMRSQALLALASHVPSASRRRELVELAVVAASRIGRHTTALRVRTALAPDLNAGQRAAVLSSAVEAVLEMDDEQEKERLLKVLGPQLTQEQAWRVAGIHPVRVLVQSAVHLPQSTLPVVLERVVAEGVADYFLEKLAPHLPAELLERALEAVPTFQVVSNRGTALCALGLRLPEHRREAVFAQALRMLLSGASMSNIPAALLPHLSTEQLMQVLARWDDVFTDRQALLRELARLVPASGLHELWSVALSASPDVRADVLAAMLSRSPRDRLPFGVSEEVLMSAYAEALAGARTQLGTAYAGAVALAPCLPAHLHTAALDLFQRNDGFLFSQIMGTFAPHLSESDLDRAADLARRMPERHAAVALLPHLPPPRRGEMFGWLMTRARQHRGELSLSGLVRHLSTSELTEMLAVVQLDEILTRSVLARAAELGAHDLFVRVFRTALLTNGRNAGLELVQEFLPTLRRLTGPGFAERLNDTIEDVHRWWP